MVVFLFWVQTKEGRHRQRPLSRSATELCVLMRAVCSSDSAAAEIGVPSIISQKTRNIGPKLIKYWPMLTMLEIQDANPEPMPPICRFQIVLCRRPDRAQ